MPYLENSYWFVPSLQPNCWQLIQSIFLSTLAVVHMTLYSLCCPTKKWINWSFLFNAKNNFNLVQDVPWHLDQQAVEVSFPPPDGAPAALPPHGLFFRSVLSVFAVWVLQTRPDVHRTGQEIIWLFVMEAHINNNAMKHGNREYLVTQIVNRNSGFHSEAKLPWSYAYPLANIILSYKFQPITSCHVFCALLLLSGIFRAFSPQWV